MCGIYGIINKNSTSTNHIKQALKTMEYRGYDSWGIGYINANDELIIEKQTGKVPEVSDENINVKIGIGHTRWATHGGVTKENAHPHLSTDHNFALVQNGIVENFIELKKELISLGYEFKTQTDTEIIVRQIESELKNLNKNVIEITKDTFVKAVETAFSKLQGRNTIVVLNANLGLIIGIRRGSPLVVAKKKDELVLASDILVLNTFDNCYILDDNQAVIFDKDNIDNLIFKTVLGESVNLNATDLTNNNVSNSKDGFEHFMIKEILEQSQTVKNSTSYSKSELEEVIDILKKSKRIYTIGAGTAAFAAAQIAYNFRGISKLDSIALKSYDMQEYADIFSEKDVMIVISQSGETADTIEALNIAKAKGMKIISLVNMIGSTIPRISDISFLTRSGPEICVASTKAFTSQIAWGYLVAYTIIDKFDYIKSQIENLSIQISDMLSNYRNLISTDLLDFLKVANSAFILGKGQNNFIALEAALKIKEITYKHFEGFTAGELKHGVIALVEKGIPVFIIISNDEYRADMISAAYECKARGASIIGISYQNEEVFDQFIQVPENIILSPILNVIPFQLIAYFIALKLNLDPDKPRNLAKSVTVK